MSNFVYLTSKDHASWYIEDPDNGLLVTNEQLLRSGRSRTSLRYWIETNCQKTVWAWNKVETPNQGEQNWGSKIAPTGNMVFHFEDANDRVFFQLAWT